MYNTYVAGGANVQYVLKAGAHALRAWRGRVGRYIHKYVRGEVPMSNMY